MRRVLPAFLVAVALLLPASAVPVQAGETLLRDGFEQGLDHWRLIRPADATVAAVRAAARRGKRGLRVASPRNVKAGATMRASATLDRARVTFDLRRESGHAARIATLHGRSGVVLKAWLTSRGRLKLSGPGWRATTRVRIPRQRWVRLAFQVEVGPRRVKVLTDGRVRQVLRRRTGSVDRVRLAGGAGPRVLSYDRFVLTGRVSTAPTDDPAPDPEPPPTPTYRFTGRGSDHGVGMSQAGAVGRARAGQKYGEILTHYYPRTTVDARPVEGRTVRVLILEGERATSASPLRVCGRGGRWTIVGSEKTFPRGACARFWRGGGTSKVEVTKSDGTSLYEGPGADRMVEPTGAQTLLEVPSRGSRDLFRGSLRVLLPTRRARVVNHVPLGSYLRGVVPLEMSPSRPRQALRAQAVAARSYAVSHLRGAARTFDLYDDSRHQVYGGVVVEAASTDEAVADTAGVLVRYDGRAASTLYHAAGGGATEDARNVFTSSDGSLGTDTPYLRGSPDVDEDGQPYDAASAYDSWRTGAFTLEELSSIMASDPRTDVGPIRKLVMRNRGVSGRLITVTVVGVDGTRKRVAGWYFKSVFNRARPEGGALLSTLFYLKSAD